MKNPFTLTAIICIWLGCMLITCGPSKAELVAMEMARQDSIHIADSVNAMAMAEKEIEAMGGKTSSPRDSDAYWATYDTGLPAGVVYNFQPESGDKDSGPFYIIVKCPDGRLTVNETNHKYWVVLQKGDLIK